MEKYGGVAVAAAARLASGEFRSARDAWQAVAGETFPDSPSSRDKACPRGAFLGLCRAGVVRSVPRTSAGDAPGTNGTYALDAVGALVSRPAIADEGPAALWATTGGRGKAHNSQMDVVLALWQEGLIVPVPTTE